MATQASLSATSQPKDPIVLASCDDLTDHEKRSCDPIISHILTLNRTGKTIDDTIRAAFWEVVFHRWTTSPAAHNYPPRPHPRQDLGTPVATLNQDVPSHEGSKKHVIAGQEPPPASAIPKERRQGATVWLQPLANFVTNQIKYKWTDSNNKIIGGAKVVSLADKTLQEAQVEAIIKRDQKELDRVGRLNIDVAIYYARQQLLAHLRLDRRDGSRKGHKRCKACKTREVSDMKEFQEIRLCGDFIEAHKGLSAGYFAHEKQPLVGPSFT
ncbi:hypothetical protein CKAH01_12025 [Colletotrichum kahawae]|uniref:Uncharacterized protein n=1 Tax=Colletotrichum kahawae TaxID=34407 RepID=A0AAD9YUG7_COLKA|nr:hypothetical protein CKAH01_12025 [Colletotrichum kahawae]